MSLDWGIILPYLTTAVQSLDFVPSFPHVTHHWGTQRFSCLGSFNTTNTSVKSVMLCLLSLKELVSHTSQRTWRDIQNTKHMFFAVFNFCITPSLVVLSLCTGRAASPSRFVVTRKCCQKKKTLWPEHCRTFVPKPRAVMGKVEDILRTLKGPFVKVCATDDWLPSWAGFLLSLILTGCPLHHFHCPGCPYLHTNTQPMLLIFQKCRFSGLLTTIRAMKWQHADPHFGGARPARWGCPLRARPTPPGPLWWN